MLSYKHEVFLEVARQLSFTKASQVLYISQPAISKHIQQLEERYKSSLFERKGSAITLTEAGSILFNHLTKAKNIEKHLEFEMNSHRDKFHIKGELKLGASTTVALYIIPPILSGFSQKHNDVRISLFNRNSESVLQALLDHEIDLGIMEGKSKMSVVNSQHFLTDEVVAVCSSRSHLKKKIKLPIGELTQIPVVLRERGSGTLAAVKYALANHGIKMSDLKTSIRLGGTEALKNFILADESMGFLPLRAVAKELASGDLVRLHFKGLTITRHFYFIQRHGDENHGLNEAFIKFAKLYYNITL